MSQSTSIEVIFFDLGDTLILTAEHRWLPGAKELLVALRRRGLRLGVISNTGTFNRDQLKSVLPADFEWSLFDRNLVLLSSEVGVSKPSPRIFEMAASRAGAAGRCLFCTEDLVDSLVAQQAGMRIVRVERPPNSDIGSLAVALRGTGVIDDRPAPSELHLANARFGETNRDPGTMPVAPQDTVPVLPQDIVNLMASRGHRLHHYLWHEVRNKWLVYDAPTREAIRELGWEPPRPSQKWVPGVGFTAILDNDSGEDFLFMHRQMIELVNRVLAQIGDPAYPQIEGWKTLPKPGDSDYPVPVWNSSDPFLNLYLKETKSDLFFQQTMQPWEQELTNADWLRGKSLGEVGARIEFTIHNRMHMRWCSNPGDIRPDTGGVQPNEIDVRWDTPAYDWLGDTYASHVHAWFWKIHGWVDARIEDWKRANDVTGPIEWKGTWVGKPLPTPGMNVLEMMLPSPNRGLHTHAPGSHGDQGHVHHQPHEEDGHDHHGHAAVLNRLLKIVQSTGLRTRFYDPVKIPEVSTSGSQVNSFKFLSQEQRMAKKQQHDDSIEADELSATVQELSQVAQSLATSAQTMMKTLELLIQNQKVPPLNTDEAPAAPSTVRINVWEDDPFSEEHPTRNPGLAEPIKVPVPVNDQRLLQFQIVEPAPAAALYSPGTAEYRFWETTEALTRGIKFWGRLLPRGTVWSTVRTPLQVRLVAGQDFNANYSRRFGLRFYRGLLQGKQFFSAESPDVTCHELGHGILDALRPELFNTASAEVAAFHESFGDMAAILNALQQASLRDKVLRETGGRLNVNSRLSRLAEQLGWAIRQLSSTSVDIDCLRNAANRFFYVNPDTLPPSAPSTQLASEGHSFSRIFTGAFLDALSRMLTTSGASTSDNLLTVSGHMGQLLVNGVRIAPITTNYYSQVAAAMIQAGRTLFGDRYRAALISGFVQHGILSPSSAAALVDSPAPQMADAGEQQLLSMGTDNAGYRSTAADAPELPTRSIKMMGMSIEVHAPQEEPLFGGASATFGISPHISRDATLDADQEASSFVEDLIQRGQLDLEPTPRNLFAGAPEDASDRAASKKTHTLVEGRDGKMVLKRLHFNCGCGVCRE